MFDNIVYFGSLELRVTHSAGNGTEHDPAFVRVSVGNGGIVGHDMEASRQELLGLGTDGHRAQTVDSHNEMNFHLLWEGPEYLVLGQVDSLDGHLDLFLGKDVGTEGHRDG